jgi:thiamine biosynthesis protein ThiI
MVDSISKASIRKKTRQYGSLESRNHADNLLVLVHYGEIALKGHNRPFFEKALVRNLETSLKREALELATRLEGRLMLVFRPDAKFEAISEVLKCFPGVASFAVVSTCDRDISAITRSALEHTRHLTPSGSFRLRIQRADKTFPGTSPEIESLVGSKIKSTTGARVSLTQPDVTVNVEIMRDKCIVYLNKMSGPGGLPVGTSGDVLTLFSGGIDSPVAAWLMLRRGCSIDLLHIYASENVATVGKSKIIAITKELAKYTSGIRLYLAPSYPFDLLKGSLQEKYSILHLRRYFFKLGWYVANAKGIGSLVVGDSLGQVASQTLDNIRATDAAVKIPILRPLLTHTKQEITDLAKKIGTYSFSLEPYKDCCSMRTSHPKTRMNEDQLDRLDNLVNLDKAVDQAAAQITFIKVDTSGSVHWVDIPGSARGTLSGEVIN